ncbi:MAG: ABC transporter ATP-binding protein [Spirochaetaceae bacterium]|jgi:ABC-type dipeptide/oligopeptide/nickel transport system ATPase subunit|nr:ABC transporter ATP-binding protein [Spirochaetaceae bacterium]
MRESGAVFELEGVRFGYKNKEILRGINLTLKKGESLGIVGESGSGKTTLLSLLLRLAKPQRGSISFFGQPFEAMNRQDIRSFRARVQPVFQDPYLSLDPSQRIEGIVGEPLDSLKLVSDKAERRSKIADALERAGIDPGAMRRFPVEFSGGQRQRIAIARALVCEPEVLIADEPVSALDIITKIEILNLIREIKESRDFTLIFVSHDLPAVADIASRIAVIDRGEIIEDAPAGELLASPRHERTRLLLESNIEL